MCLGHDFHNNNNNNNGALGHVGQNYDLILVDIIITDAALRFRLQACNEEILFCTTCPTDSIHSEYVCAGP